MQHDLPVIPKINYDFDSEPNFDNDSAFSGEDQGAYVLEQERGDVTYLDLPPTLPHHFSRDHSSASSHHPDIHHPSALDSTVNDHYNSDHDESDVRDDYVRNDNYARDDSYSNEANHEDDRGRGTDAKWSQLKAQNNRMAAVVTQMRSEMSHIRHANAATTPTPDPYKRQPPAKNTNRNHAETNTRAHRTKTRDGIGSKHAGQGSTRKHERHSKRYQDTDQGLSESDAEGDYSNADERHSESDESHTSILFHRRHGNEYSRNTLADGTTKHVQELERLVAKYQDELLAAINEIQEYETHLSSVKAELTSCKFAIRQKQMHLQNAHRQTALLQRQCESYQDDLHTTREANKILEGHISELQLGITLLKSESRHTDPILVQHRNEGFDKLVAENKFLRLKMEEATKDIKRLMHEKEKLIDISNMLRADLVQLTDRLETNTSLVSTTEHYENKITELEMLVRKLDLHNKVLRKDLDDMHKEEKHQTSGALSNPLYVKGQHLSYDANTKSTSINDAKQMPLKELHDKRSNFLKSQKQQDQKAKLLEQRNAIMQTVQRKNNK